jgi:hypothetical protein
MPGDTPHKHSLWVGVGEKVISFVVGLIVAAFFLGGARARVASLGKDMEDWKAEWKIERDHIYKMDREGSQSFHNFYDGYKQEQAKQYEHLSRLDTEVKPIDGLKYRIEQLEKKDPPEQKQKPKQ